MPVRTSAVVAGGLSILTMVGVATVFGDSLMALVAPPSVESAAVSTPSRPAPAGGLPVPPAAARSAAPAAPDGGGNNNSNRNP